MNSKLGRLALILGAAGLTLSGAAAYADGPRGGEHFGGGARVGGGAHFGGGGHFDGGARAAPPAHFGGAPARAAVAAPRFGAAARYTGGARFAPSPTRHYVVAGHGNWNRSGGARHWDGDRRWGGDRHWDRDDRDHDRYWAGTYWGGGYWGGGYWPGVSYGVNFAWFLPVLPALYTTYWYSGVPYYYANDVYYTWDPGYDGYVATDPPPVADSATSSSGGADQIYMYPDNGQSTEQQAEDRRACEQWATDQVGANGGADDYRRAMTACAEGRGYTVR